MIFCATATASFGYKKKKTSYIPNLTSFFAVFVSVWLVTLVSCSALFLFFVEKKKKKRKKRRKQDVWIL